MKKIIKWSLILIVTFSVGSLAWATKDIPGVKAIEISEIDLSVVEDGVYQGSYKKGRFSNSLTVKVENNHIKDIEVSKRVLSSDEAFVAELVEKVIMYQSVKVDAVSSATYTTNAYLKAIENALSGYSR